MVSAATCFPDHSQLDVASHIRQMSVQQEMLHHIQNTHMAIEVRVNSK